jgi:hypothetical protein
MASSLRQLVLASNAGNAYELHRMRVFWVPFLSLCPALVAQTAPSETPRTVPEQTGHAATSTAAQVEAFLNACVRLPHGDRLTVSVAGKSHEGRAQLLVKLALPQPTTPPPLRMLVIANIHAGETEGKEALQMLAREVALGQHEELLQQCTVWFVPIYNVDGNEQLGPKNREGQNGPDVVGVRAQAQGLDLNRDFVKADAVETRNLLALFRSIDPHLFVDLHTTNGSAHGYHLTYAPCLSPNQDHDLARMSRDLLDAATTAMQQGHGYRTFDYGNFETKDWDGSGAPESPNGVRGWYTYDHRPRYGINYFGLRNRLAVLSEAYSYDDFATRIASTRAFVLVLLQRLCAQQAAVLATIAAADARLADATNEPVWFGSDTAFATPETLDVLVGVTERVDGKDGAPMRFVRKGEAKPESMPVVRAFQARAHRVLPAAWAILAPSPEVVGKLQQHGVQFTAITATRTVQAQRFAVTGKKKPKRPYQGHQELVLHGNWDAPAAVELPLGTLVVPATQPLGRLAATLLEPESEDSLSTWNFFEAATRDHYPVLRLLDD